MTNVDDERAWRAAHPSLFRRCREWVRGWWATYQMWRHDRETYDFLANYRHDPDDFVDAPSPT